ncbi:MAG: transcriptional repressor LexA [Candidatus Gracilibacteria bacterium]
MMIYTSARPVQTQMIIKTTSDRVYRFLRDYFNTTGYAPTVRQIMRYMGLGSTNSVYKHLKKLEREGRISRTTTGKIILGESSSQALPFLGGIKAGFSAPADEAGMDVLSLDEFMIHHPERTFLLTVRGDSMQDAAIVEGDYVLVERGAAPHHGQIVVAAIDGAFTLKYFMKDQGKTFLRAANPKYPDFYPSEELQIVGVVIGVMRKCFRS